jgi:hypothetical protein
MHEHRIKSNSILKSNPILVTCAFASLVARGEQQAACRVSEFLAAAAPSGQTAETACTLMPAVVGFVCLPFWLFLWSLALCGLCASQPQGVSGSCCPDTCHLGRQPEPPECSFPIQNA